MTLGQPVQDFFITVSTLDDELLSLALQDQQELEAFTDSWDPPPSRFMMRLGDNPPRPPSPQTTSSPTRCRSRSLLPASRSRFTRTSPSPGPSRRRRLRETDARMKTPSLAGGLSIGWMRLRLHRVGPLGQVRDGRGQGVRGDIR